MYMHNGNAKQYHYFNYNIADDMTVVMETGTCLHI